MRLLERLGLGRRDLRAWAMYDWANSAVQTTIIAAIFPIYFQKVAAAGMPGPVATSRFAWATTIAILIVAVIAPLLGAVADYAAGQEAAARACSSAIGAARPRRCSSSRAATGCSRWSLFVIANVGVAGSIVFYESLLPHLAGEDELDRVSTAGYALGYLGGGVLLAINILMMSKPEWFCCRTARSRSARAWPASRCGGWCSRFRSSATSPSRPRGSSATSARRATRSPSAVRRLLETLRELRRYRQAFLLLLAFLLYNDGIQTIIRMATIYGTEIGIDENAMIGALLITQFIGVPFAFLFGMLRAARSAPSAAVFVGLAVYAVITVLGYFMRTSTHFFVLAILVGHGAGGHAGAEPVALRQHDPEAQVVGVLRLLRRVRALRGDSRPGGVRLGGGAQRHQPQRDPLGARVLRRRRRAADARGRGRRPPRRAGGRVAADRPVWSGPRRSSDRASSLASSARTS